MSHAATAGGRRLLLLLLLVGSYKERFAGARERFFLQLCHRIVIAAEVFDLNFGRLLDGREYGGCTAAGGYLGGWRCNW